MRTYLFFAYLFASFLFASNSYAKKLNVYYCESISAAAGCAKGCKNTTLDGQKFDPAEAQRMEFQINQKNGSVLVKTFFGNKFSESRVDKNCQIFDTNNWDCSEEPFWVPQGKWFVIQTNKMVDGVYMHGIHTTKEGIYSKTFASCAK